jgi:ribonuclease-3
MNHLERIQQRIGYRFQRPDLLAQALTHRSHSTTHNERLEFLGDSVLGCVIADELYRRFDRLEEGVLTRLRASLVRQESLHQVAQALELGDCLKLGEGELKSGAYTRPSILADALEAIFGAVFLDGGYGPARALIVGLYAEALDQLDPKSPSKDPKTRLQEWLQSRRMALPRYAITSTQGAAHNQSFQVECAIPELSLRATGSGVSRRAAEQAAAQGAFELLPK